MPKQLTPQIKCTLSNALNSQNSLFLKVMTSHFKTSD